MFSRSTDIIRQPESSPSATPSSPIVSSPMASPQMASPQPIAKLTPQSAAPATVVTEPDGRLAPSKVSVIGNDLTILGQDITIISKGSLQLDGAIQGNLHGTEILVGEKGRVEGTIAAQSIVIRGTVKGVVRALRVALQEGAHVDGEIHHQTLTVDAKAHFEGKSRRPANTDELMPDLDPASHDKKVRSSTL